MPIKKYLKQLQKTHELICVFNDKNNLDLSFEGFVHQVKNKSFILTVFNDSGVFVGFSEFAYREIVYISVGTLGLQKQRKKIKEPKKYPEIKNLKLYEWFFDVKGLLERHWS